MKNSAIRNAFYEMGQALRMNDKERGLWGAVAETYDAFEICLTPEQKELHDRFITAHESASAEEAFVQFSEGFKLGLLTGIECMDD